GPGVGERARRDREEALPRDLELDARTWLNVGLVEVLTRQVQLHVAERVDVENCRRDPARAQLGARQLEADQRAGIDRRPELTEGETSRQVSCRGREDVAPVE